MTGTSSRLDFRVSLDEARRDAALRHQLTKHFGTEELSPPDKSDLVSSSFDVIEWTLLEARKLYVEKPERLKCLISSSEVANALAVWPPSGQDWIVVSEGLLRLLASSADQMAKRLEDTFPEVAHSRLGKDLQSQSPLGGGIHTALGSFLYFGALSFFVGHEAGHHLAGHNGHYLSGAHTYAGDEPDDGPATSRMIEQALERQADRIGITFSRIAMAKLLAKLWDVQAFSEAAQREYQRVLAVLVGAGPLVAALKIRPVEIDWDSLPRKSHPPAVFRILAMAAEISAALKANFPLLDDVSRRWIRLMSVEFCVAATIKPGSEQERSYLERLGRGGEPPAIRVVGIRKALYDSRFNAYNQQLSRTLEEVRPKLRPRSKASFL